jgi:hypothetical protein
VCNYRFLPIYVHARYQGRTKKKGCLEGVKSGCTLFGIAIFSKSEGCTRKISRSARAGEGGGGGFLGLGLASESRRICHFHIFRRVLSVPTSAMVQHFGIKYTKFLYLLPVPLPVVSQLEIEPGRKIAASVQ